LLCFTYDPLLAATYIVNTTSDDVTMEVSLRNAISKAGDGDIISFDLPYPSVIKLKGNQLDINRNITIQGPGADKLSISGEGKSRVFNLSRDSLAKGSSTIVISELTIMNGYSSSGGGIFCDPSATGSTKPITLRECIIRDNLAELEGAGLYSKGNNIKVVDCTFKNNGDGEKSAEGGGIYSYLDDITIINCTFFGNSALHGGAIFNSERLTLHGEDNIMNCTFTENQGGALTNVANSPTISNCIFWNNPPQEIDNHNSTPFLDHCVVTHGFIDIGKGSTYNVLIKADPLLGPLAKYGATETCSLGIGSSAIDSGITLDAVTTDQRGIPRPQGANYDIGAFEKESDITLGDHKEIEGDSGCSSGIFAPSMLLLIAPLLLLVWQR
jgi:hypothetical protein